jgi:hypothetical protein
MGYCCGPCSAATRICSSFSSREVKMFLLMPSLSPCLLDPAALTHPHRTRLPHPSTRTPSVMESCVLVVVKAINVGSSSSPPPTDPTWDEREGGALPDWSGFKRQLWARRGSCHRRHRHAATSHPTATVVNKSLS